MPKVPRRPDLERLAGTAPEWFSIATGEVLWRVYFRGGDHPARWNQFRTFGPTDARFDHHSTDPGDDERASMYLALNPVTCLAEIFQKTRTVNRTHRKPVLVGFALASVPRLLDLTGLFPTRIGASMALMTGSRAVAREWARALYMSYPQAQGFAYPSSMHANAVAIVLNDRVDVSSVFPRSPGFHKALDDGGMVTLLKNAARDLGYALR